MDTVQQILIAARALIATPEKWTQGESARTSYGLPCGFYADCADQFCMSGALERVCSGDRHRASVAGNYLRDAISASSFVNWNDAPERTHADVMAAFDRAIELAGKPEVA